MNDADFYRFNVAERNRWQMTFNDRCDRWIIQHHNQVVGNIGTGLTLRAAVDDAIACETDAGTLKRIPVEQTEPRVERGTIH